MESEQSKNFNDRLSQWVADQGFWFQIRHSLTGTGSGGNVMFHLLRMSFRLLIFLLIVAVGVSVYLLRIPNSTKFSEGLEAKLKAGLYASTTGLKGVSKIGGNLVINKLEASGENETFFKSIEAQTIRCKMGLLDGISGHWDTGTISLAKLGMELRAGADDAESARKFSKALFSAPSSVTVNHFEIADASLSWGYSDRTKGAVDHSALKINREGNGWRLTFAGGSFSQNWLHQLEIVELVITCDPEGMTFEKAELRSGQGTVSFAGLKIKGGECPQIEGLVKIRNLPLKSLIPTAVKSVIEGSISGDFTASGSTNSAEGLSFEGVVTLGEGDSVTLLDRLYLLKALSGVDYKHSYRRVNFTEGSLRLQTTGGKMAVTEVNLKAGDAFSLEGSLLARLPTAEETKLALESAPEPDQTAKDSGSTEAPDANSTPRGAAEEAKRQREKAMSSAAGMLSDRVNNSLEGRMMEIRASESFSKTFRYEGTLKISIPPDAFDAGSKLLTRYPVNPGSNRIEVMVPLEGTLQEITLKQGEELYKLRESENR
jgi:hypothetical protein